MPLRPIHTIAMLAITLPMIGCVAQSDSAGETAATSVTGTEPIGTSAQALTCLDQCIDAHDQCDYECEMQYSPYWDEPYYNACVADCGDDFQACTTSDYRYAGKTYQICHFDPDTHIDGVDIELYTSDRYVDYSCAANIDRFKKRLLDTVHCGFHSESTCKSRVQDRVITTWLPQGYYPTVTEAEKDLDKCPYPRL